MGWFVIVGTLPIGILGAAFQDTIETSLRDLRIIGTTLIVFGLALAAADRMRAVRYARPMTELTYDVTSGFLKRSHLIRLIRSRAEGEEARVGGAGGRTGPA